MHVKRRIGSGVSAAAVASLIAVAMASGATGGVGCAASEPVELTPDVDPNLPTVDAGNTATPAPGTKPGPSTKDAGVKDSGGASSSSSSSTSSTGGSSTSSTGGSSTSSSGGSSTSSTGGSSTSSTGGSTSSSSSGGTPASKPLAGEVFISEVLYDSAGAEPDAEWIEVHSGATVVRALSGLTLKDGASRTHVIGAGVTIDPGAYVVLARSKAAAIAAQIPSAAIVYEYGTGIPVTAGILLANGPTGAISLLDGTTVLSSVPYGGWFTQSSGGSSIQMAVLNAALSSAKASWCLSSVAWAAGSAKGTPGAASDCP